MSCIRLKRAATKNDEAKTQMTTRLVRINIRDGGRVFDIDEPKRPGWIDTHAPAS